MNPHAAGNRFLDVVRGANLNLDELANAGKADTSKSGAE